MAARNKVKIVTTLRLIPFIEMIINYDIKITLCASFSRCD